MSKKTIREEILSLLSGREIDNSPTQEHQCKVDFSVKEGQYRKKTIADRLYGGGRISQDEYDATIRWTNDYVVSYDGVGALQDHASTSIIKHDAISFAMQMASAKDSIPAIKEIIGAPYHNMLVLSCYHGYSSGHLAKVLSRSRSVQSSSSAIDRIFVDVYRSLYKAYLSLTKIKKKTVVQGE